MSTKRQRSPLNAPAVDDGRAARRRDIEQLFSIMAELGFRTSSGNGGASGLPEFDASFLSFERDVGSVGELVRMTLHFEKPTLVRQSMLLQRVVITRQQTLDLADPGLPEAPLLVRDELAEIRRRCARWMVIDDQSPVRRTCSRCGASATNYFDLPPNVYCVPCMQLLEPNQSTGVGVKEPA